MAMYATHVRASRIDAHATPDLSWPAMATGSHSLPRVEHDQDRQPERDDAEDQDDGVDGHGADDNEARTSLDKPGRHARARALAPRRRLHGNLSSVMLCQVASCQGKRLGRDRGKCGSGLSAWTRGTLCGGVPLATPTRSERR